jgi:transposase
VKDYRDHSVATLFGQVTMRLPRFRCAGCGGIEAGIGWPSHCRSTPELDQLQAHLSALLTYRVAADLLQQMLPVDAGKDPETLRRHTLRTGEALQNCAATKPGTAAPEIVVTVDSTFVRSCEDGERHLEVRVGNVETEAGGRQVFGAVARAESDIAVRIRRSLDTVGRTEDTALTAFTDGCPGLRRILADAGVAGPPILDCWCGRPPTASMCQNEVVADLRLRRPSVDQISRIGMDTSKHIFQLHGVDAAEAPVLRKKLRRKEIVAFFGKLAPTVIAIEACGASHHWARLLQSVGHSVKLIPPQLVKPYVKRAKNDAADAEALCEAMSRPTMRFVPVKTAEQQAALMLVGVRDRLIRNRTQLSNAIRGYAAEFGLTSAKGMAHLVPLLERIQADESLPVLARELFAMQAEGYTQLQAQIDELDAKLAAWHRADECSRRLAKIPGVGPIGAVLLRMKTPDPELFRSGRQFAAWIGLTPKDHSTAGKVRLGVITRAGDEGLRSVLVVGATSVILQVRRGRTASPWLAELLRRKSPKLAAVALANKMARIAWRLMLTGETYTAKSASAALAGAV